MKKPPHFFPSRSGRRQLAFSLVEVALALGVVGFALVGIVGALPVAMNNERMSVAQTRAATVANTIFARFRAQPFGAVSYSDDDVDPTKFTLNLNDRNTVLHTDPTQDDPVVVADAVFDEAITPAQAATADGRRLHIYADPNKVPKGTPSYKVVFRFKNNPPGMLAPYKDASGTLHAQGSAIEISVFQDAQPTNKDYSTQGKNPPRSTDIYRFNTVIANRTQ